METDIQFDNHVRLLIESNQNYLNCFGIWLVFLNWSFALFGLIFIIQNQLEAEWLEGVAQTLVEFAHELNPESEMKTVGVIEVGVGVCGLPVQTQGVQEGGQAFHHDQNGEGEDSPSSKYDVQHDWASGIGALETLGQHHVPQYFGQFWKGISVIGWAL